jgi:hypothetical protein
MNYDTRRGIPTGLVKIRSVAARSVSPFVRLGIHIPGLLGSKVIGTQFLLKKARVLLGLTCHNDKNTALGVWLGSRVLGGSDSHATGQRGSSQCVSNESTNNHDELSLCPQVSGAQH